MPKQDLLLLHGALGSSSQVVPLSIFLEDQFNLGLLNFTGHGNQSLFVHDFSFDLFVEDILNWMKKKSLQKVSVFGYSMGGYAALLFAYRYPEKIDRIFTLGTKLLWTQEEADGEARLLDPAKIEEKVPQFAERLKQAHGLTNWANLVHKTKSFIQSMGATAPLNQEAFENIQCRVLLGVGDKDTMAKVDDTVKVYGWIKNGELLVIPNTPHPFERVNMEALSNQIIRFMKS